MFSTRFFFLRATMDIFLMEKFLQNSTMEWHSFLMMKINYGLQKPMQKITKIRWTTDATEFSAEQHRIRILKMPFMSGLWAENLLRLRFMQILLSENQILRKLRLFLMLMIAQKVFQEFYTNLINTKWRELFSWTENLSVVTRTKRVRLQIQKMIPLRCFLLLLICSEKNL